MTKEMLAQYQKHLKTMEKAPATVDKYVHVVWSYYQWLGGRKADKQSAIEYKQFLIEKYAPASVNVFISALNSFFEFLDREDYKIRTVRLQRPIFVSESKNLTREEYERLILASGKRLSLVMQTLCSSGLRVSELKFVTVEAVHSGYASVNCKGKLRAVILPQKLCQTLSDYADGKKLVSGSIFLSRCGNPLDRSNIWSEMKRACKRAGIPREKVFPHNLRHLFAKTYYSSQQDIVRLADILGHSSLNTTRIYTMESSEKQRRQIEQLNLCFTH